MKVYLVGGAVRDQLLGLAVKERDWVVVGATPEQMLAAGFQPVGKAFPVFLHPETHEEYALARTERKIGKGYKGFTFYADASITLEQDLKRRDLTINAIAQDEKGQLIDPFHGQRDLKQRRLRHVCEAFQEDPVRILRLARFAARFTEFSVDPDTLRLMQSMVNAGEVDALVAERVWQELHRALQYAQPLRFFTVLANCHAFAKLFPELALSTHGMQQLNSAPQEAKRRLAVLLHDLAPAAINTLCARLRVPNDYKQFAQLIAQLGPQIQALDTGDAAAILQLINQGDALRRTRRFYDFLQLCQLCFPNGDAKKNLLQNAITAVKSVDTKELQAQNLKGKQFAEQLNTLRLSAIKKIIQRR